VTASLHQSSTAAYDNYRKPESEHVLAAKARAKALAAQKLKVRVRRHRCVYLLTFSILTALTAAVVCGLVYLPTADDKSLMALPLLFLVVAWWIAIQQAVENSPLYTVDPSPEFWYW
jgi:uncharacterized membrane protein YhdT